MKNFFSAAARIAASAPRIIRLSATRPLKAAPLPQPTLPKIKIDQIASASDLSKRFYAKNLQDLIKEATALYEKNRHLYEGISDLIIEQEGNGLRRIAACEVKKESDEIIKKEIGVLIVDREGNLLEYALARDYNPHTKTEELQNLYQLFLDHFSSLPGLYNIAAKIVKSKEQDYSQDRLQRLWKEDKLLCMRMLSEATSFIIRLPDEVINYNNFLYHGTKYVDPRRIAVGKKFDSEKLKSRLESEKKQLEEKGLKLDMLSGGEASVLSFRRYVQSQIYQSKIQGVPLMVTPQENEVTKVPCAMRSAVIASRSLKGCMFHYISPGLGDFAFASSNLPPKPLPKGVGIIIDPEKGGIFPYAAKRDQTSDKGSLLEENAKIFGVESWDAKSGFEYHFAKSIEEVAHQIKSENLSSENPWIEEVGRTTINRNYAKERDYYWSETVGIYPQQAVIAIVTLDLSPKSVNYILDLLQRYPDRAVVRYSYITNELVPLDLGYLQNLANYRFRNLAISQKLAADFAAIDKSIKLRRQEKDVEIIIAKESPWARPIAEAGERFFESSLFYKESDAEYIITLNDARLAAFEDFIAELKKTSPLILALTNQLFVLRVLDYNEVKDLTPELRAKMGKYDQGKIYTTIKADVKTVKYEEIGERQRLVNFALHPERICFVFSHPQNPQIECVFFFEDKTNHCLFFEKNGEERKFLGAAPHVLLQEKWGEYSRARMADLAEISLYQKNFDQSLRKKIIKAGVEVAFDMDALAVKFFGSEVNPKKDPLIERCQEFVGEGFVGSHDSSIATLSESEFKFLLRQKSEEIYTKDEAGNIAPAFVEERSSGWRYSEKGEVEIIFDCQQHRDNFIRLFNGDLPGENGLTLFAIDDFDEAKTKLIIRKEFVDEMEKIDANSGRKKSLKLFVDMSNLNNSREIDFQAMKILRSECYPSGRAQEAKLAGNLVQDGARTSLTI